MNPLVVQILTRLLTLAFAGLSGWLVAQGWFTEAEMGTYVTAGITGLIGVIGAIWLKYRDRLKLLIAMAMPEPTSERVVEQKYQTMTTETGLPPATLPAERVPHLGSSQETREQTGRPYTK